MIKRRFRMRLAGAGPGPVQVTFVAPVLSSSSSLVEVELDSVLEAAVLAAAVVLAVTSVLMLPSA